MSNRTRQIASYPRTLFLASLYLRRRIEENQDELKMNADTLNAMLVEVERMEEVLGLSELTGPETTLAFQSLFGDGSDGNVTISTNTTLTRDMYYNNLLITNGTVLIPDGYRIFVRNTLTLKGRIASDGGTGDPGGTAAASGGAGFATTHPLGGAGVGGDSSTTNGSNGANSARRGGAGGDGGTGSGGSAGTGGTVAAASGEYGMADIPTILEMYSKPTARIEGGAGGGGGAGDSSLTGGAGGGGGGVIMIAAYNLKSTYDPTSTTFKIQAKGGNGGTADTNQGTGGGGGGGVVVLLTHILENINEPPFLASNPSGDIPIDGLLDATGGATGTGLGNAGNAGADGEVYDVRI